MYDLDGNGFISRQEMSDIVRSIYKMVGIVDISKSTHRVDEIFGKMDVDVDGKLSESEFVEGTKYDVAVMKLLQCDWESSFVQNLANTTTAAAPAKSAVKSVMSAPVVTSYCGDDGSKFLRFDSNDT